VCPVRVCPDVFNPTCLSRRVCPVHRICPSVPCMPTAPVWFGADT
jgi:hypothetical protein